MTPDMSRRYALALYLALSAAVGVGLLSMPAFDPMYPLRPWLGAWSAGALLAMAALAGGLLSLRQLGRSIHPAWSTPVTRAILWLTWAIALAIWSMGLLHAQAADGRALLWLTLSPLWLAASGLWGRALPGSGVAPQRLPIERFPQRGEGLGMVEQVDVRRPLDVQRPGAGQERVRGREDDVVAMAVNAEEQLVA